MRKRELILTASALLVSLLGIFAQASEKPGGTLSPLIYELIVDGKVGPSTDAVMCRLRIRNDTDALQHAFRPQEKDMTLAVERVESASYSVVFEGNPFFENIPVESWNKFDIYLRPHCTIEIKLAKIVLRGPVGAKAPLPPGRYGVTATWKDPSLPTVTGSAFKIVEQDVPAVPQAQSSGNEYPFEVALEPASKIYYRDEPVSVAIHFENRGSDAVVLMNHFSSYRDFFLFEKKYATSGEKMQDPLYARAAITPLARVGWITLLPREHLWVNLDISDEFPIPAQYSVSTTYLRTLSLHPLQGEPRYTKQYKWGSGEVAITLSDVPGPDGKPNAAQPPLSYELLVDKKVGPHTDAVMCRLRIRNNTDKLQHTFRPQAKDIALTIKRAGWSHRPIVFEEPSFESLNKTSIYLRPHCAIEVKLAKIVMKERGIIRMPFPPGYYAVGATWKEPGLPKVRDGVFEIVEQDVSSPPQVKAASDEYPFVVVLEPASPVYYRGEPVVVTIYLENQGNDAVTLINHFSPYRDFFLFEKKYATSGEKVQDPRVFRGTIDPATGEGYVALLPGERLSVSMDISNEFRAAAEYSVGATFLGTLSLKSHYSKQYKWPSSEVVMTISDATRPNE